MKVVYKGFKVDAHREKSRKDDTLLYYSIFRQSDGFEVISGFSYGDGRVRVFIKYLKDTVDDFIENPQDYCRVKSSDEEIISEEGGDLENEIEDYEDEEADQ